MSPKFTPGQIVTNIYLGETAEVQHFLHDAVSPRYAVKYIESGHELVALESVLSGDTSEPYGVPAVQASLIGLQALVEAATSARILGTLSNYQLERIGDIVADAKYGIYTRASLPTDYL
jgi:hypothetical protein